MKFYSDFSEKYVNDICQELRSKNIMTTYNQSYEPENFESLTEFLQLHIIKSLDLFTYLDGLDLVNRGRCPYTGECIDESYPFWSFMRSRRVYVSHEGLKLMQQEADERFERTMGRPAPVRSESGSGKSGCYIATACYENEFCPEVLILKSYRDKVLAKSFFGKLFIKIYYLISPPIANWLSEKNAINTFIRECIINKIVERIK